MIVLYLALLLLLVALHLFVRWRAWSLERRFVRVAADADKLVKQSSYRGGNSNRPDACSAARQQYELALLTLKRDRIESRYTWWQGLAERLANWRKGLMAYRGKLVPYVFGVADVAAIVVALQKLGLGLGELRSMIGL
jgi:hypothetical protein